MELVVLGCWAPYPRAGGACPGYLIRDGGANVLLDAGSGSLSRLMQFTDFRSLDAVVISHYHPDHYHDLYPLRHAVEGALRDGSRAGALKLYAPAAPEKDFKRLSSYTAFETVAIGSLPMEDLGAGTLAHRADIRGLKFHFVPALHVLPGYSVSVTGNVRLAYSGDTERTPQLVALAAGADLFLCEASGLDGDAEYLRGFHLTAREAGEVAGEAGVKRLIITHFWPEYDPRELARQAAEGFGGEVETAREGEVYNV